jgi:predicted transcriptional regulator
VYRAALREEETQGLLIDRLLDAAFGGSALKLVVQALGHQRTSQAELDQIRDLLNEMEEQKNTTEKGGTNELA